MLTSGTRLASHEVLALLGPPPSSGREGGMGEMCQVREAKLGLSVAIKVLPEAFVDDPEWLR